MKYIAVEGSSYVGKTTVVGQFADVGIRTLPEYDSFGPFLYSGNTYKDRKVASLELISREVRRSLLLGRIASSEMVIADRSILSFITFEDMMIINSKSDKEKILHSDIRKLLIESLNENVINGNIVMPDGIFVMRMDSEKAFTDRVAERGITQVRELSRSSIQKTISQNAYKYSQTILGVDSSRTMDVSDKSRYDVFTEAQSIIDGLHVSTNKKPLLNLMDDI